MKKSIILSFILIGTFVSCKKSNSGGASYHVTSTFDGSSKAFNASPIASTTTSSGATMVSVTGFVSTSSMEAIILMIDNSSSGKAIVAGTYTDTTAGFDVTCAYTLAGGGKAT